MVHVLTLALRDGPPPHRHWIEGGSYTFAQLQRTTRRGLGANSPLLRDHAHVAKPFVAATSFADVTHVHARARAGGRRGERRVVCLGDLPDRRAERKFYSRRDVNDKP